MAQEQPAGQTEVLLGIASRPIYPFFIMKFEPADEKSEAYLASLKVRTEVYHYIKSIFGSDEVTFYLDPLQGKMEAWTPSMHASFEFSRRLNLMKPVRQWIQEARGFLAKVTGGMRTSS